MPAGFNQYFHGLSVSCPSILPVMDFPHCYLMVFKSQIQYFLTRPLRISPPPLHTVHDPWEAENTVWSGPILSVTWAPTISPYQQNLCSPDKVLLYISVSLWVLFLSTLHDSRPLARRGLQAACWLAQPLHPGSVPSWGLPQDLNMHWSNGLPTYSQSPYFF